MIRILLLDCSDPLTGKLKDQGYDVESGTAGYCTGVRRLPSQVYEKDLFIYNPNSIKLFNGTGITNYDISDRSPDYSLEYLRSRIESGGTFVAFVNRLSNSPDDQNCAYEWIPFMPPISFTRDKIVIANPLDEFPDSKWSALIPILRTDKLKLPVLQEINAPEKEENKRDVTTLFWNGNGAVLGVVLDRGRGSLVLLPTFTSNEEVIETFLDRVLPKLYNLNARTSLIELFTSPAEYQSQTEVIKLQTERENIEQRLGIVKVELEKARRTKVNILNADATVKQILIYYDQARKQDDVALFYLYKIIEVIENKYGGEATGIKAVGAGTEWKAVKKMANLSYGDARHAPKPSDVIKNWSQADIKTCFANTETVILAYFASLFGTAATFPRKTQQ